MSHAPPRAGRRRRALRVIGWNVLIAVAGLALVAGGAEIYLRLTWPFAHIERPTAFVPGVGPLIRPGAEVRHTNIKDFWTVQRANSLGFLDREPIDPRRAAESCHIAMIGDSFVEAAEVPIADKFHVRLEELAARALPGLDVTTSAWGVRRTGTIAQLPLYDAYARRMKPKILVLVVFGNDFRDNVPLYEAIRSGADPDRRPFLTAVRSANGTIALTPARRGRSDEAGLRLERLPTPPSLWPARIVESLRPDSYFANYLWKLYALYDAHPSAEQRRRQRELYIEILRQRPHYAYILPDFSSGTQARKDAWAWGSIYGWERLMRGSPRAREYILDFTAFGIDRFKERADRDGAAFLILSVPEPGARRDWAVEELNAMARERGVALIDLHDYIARQGGDVRGSRFAHDVHWNAAGHRWAAEALLEWLARNRDACGGEGGGAVDETPARG